MKIFLLLISGSFFVFAFPVSEVEWYDMRNHDAFLESQKIMAICRATKLKCIAISKELNIAALEMCNPKINFWEQSFYIKENNTQLQLIQKECEAVYEQLGLIQKELNSRKYRSQNKIYSIDSSSIFKKFNCEKE